MPVSVSFSVPGKAVSKSNYRQSTAAKARDEWRRIKQYEYNVGMAAIAAGAKKYMGRSKVFVDIRLWNQPIDPDGVFKAALDGLKRVAYPDDAARWVRGCRVQAFDVPAEGVRTDFRVVWENPDD